MTDRGGIFSGEDPFAIARRWLAEAEPVEPSDPNAMALSTVDDDGLPNTRIVLLKAIETDSFVFFTNYESAKGREIAATGKASFVLFWKSLARQIRARGAIAKVSDEDSDAYYATRPLGSRIGAWASKQSSPLASRAALMRAVVLETAKRGTSPKRPPHWGGYRIIPQEIEFWAAHEFRLHDRFRWTRETPDSAWEIQRLNP